MANPEHLRVLSQGVDSWNEWRRETPGVQPDLSGEDLRPYLVTTRPGASALRRVEHLDLRRTNLRSSNLSGIELVRVDLSGADLSEANISDCQLVNAKCGVTLHEIEKQMAGTRMWGKVSLVGRFPEEACKFERTRVFGTVFKRVSLSYADLSTIKVDESTRFENVGCYRTRITRASLEMLDGYGGLGKWRRSQMRIVDDVATLRESFGGMWNGIHLAAMAVFLAPYIWFVASQWIRARVGEVLPAGTQSITLWQSLCNFVVSGGNTWRQWEPRPEPVQLFLFALVFNVLRGTLYCRTRFVEHKQMIAGVYLDYPLKTGWRVALWSYRVLGAAGIPVLVLHTRMFFEKAVPL